MTSTDLKTALSSVLENLIQVAAATRVNFNDDPMLLFPDIAESYRAKCPKVMYFSAMKRKVTLGTYSTCDEFIADFDLIISNATSYNPVGDFVHLAALTLKQEAQPHIEALRKKFVPQKPNKTTTLIKIRGPQSAGSGQARSGEKREREGPDMTPTLRPMEVPTVIRSFLQMREKYWHSHQPDPEKESAMEPATVCVSEILARFHLSVQRQPYLTREQTESYRLACENVKEAFNAALAHILLYDSERLAFHKMVFMRKLSLAHQDWADVFGVEHLLRLIMHLPAMMSILAGPEKVGVVEGFLPKLEDLLKFLEINANAFRIE